MTGKDMAASRSEPLLNLRFRVEVDGMPETGVVEVVFPQARLRGGAHTANRASYGTLVLRRGVRRSQEWHTWWEETRKTRRAGSRTVNGTLLDCSGASARRVAVGTVWRERAALDVSQCTAARLFSIEPQRRTSGGAHRDAGADGWQFRNLTAGHRDMIGQTPNDNPFSGRSSRRRSPGRPSPEGSARDHAQGNQAAQDTHPSVVAYIQPLGLAPTGSRRAAVVNPVVSMLENQSTCHTRRGFRGA